MSVVQEAIIIGLATAIIGSIIHYIIESYTNDKSNQEKINRNLVITFFMTGVAIHLISEYSGTNAWYCKYGSACATNDGFLNKFVKTVTF